MARQHSYDLDLFRAPSFRLIGRNMASTMIEERLKKIDGLKFFIKSVEEKVRAITNELNWNYDELEKKETSLTTCSVHPEHRVGNSRLKEHEEHCRWIEDGYHRTDVAFPEFYGQGSHIVFTPELQERVIKERCKSLGEGSSAVIITPQRGIPQTSSRFDIDFSREEKLAIYDYVVANTEKQIIYKDLTVLAGKEPKTEEKLMTPLEIAAAERDAKRRRASYRNKVHTNRKTQTEILREVIQSQMETLAEETSFEKNSKEKQPTNDERSSSTSHPKRPRKPDEYHKPSESKDHRRSHSCRDSKYKDKYWREEERNKSKKRKRSRSRSNSRDRSRYKKSHTHRSHSSSVRY